MTQLPFSPSHSCTKFPLELVHNDVWGPAPISSINGFRYYVIFVDDFTRFTWFFPLRHKSQVFSSFQHFKTTMENFLAQTVKFYVLIVGVNILIMNSVIFVLNTELFINSLALTPLNKTVLPKENIVTLLT